MFYIEISIIENKGRVTVTDVVCSGVEGDRLYAARLLGQGQLGGRDALGGQRVGRGGQAPQLDLKYSALITTRTSP